MVARDPVGGGRLKLRILVILPPERRARRFGAAAVARRARGSVGSRAVRAVPHRRAPTQDGALPGELACTSRAGPRLHWR